MRAAAKRSAKYRSRVSRISPCSCRHPAPYGAIHGIYRVYDRYVMGTSPNTYGILWKIMGFWEEHEAAPGHLGHLGNPNPHEIELSHSRQNGAVECANTFFWPYLSKWPTDLIDFKGNSPVEPITLEWLCKLPTRSVHQPQRTPRLAYWITLHSFFNINMVAIH